VTAKYDAIGRDYRPFRVADPRIARILHASLAGSETVLNIGAGAGSYEPQDASVIALEPSRIMLAQRGPGLAPAVQGNAEALPFADDQFDAAMGVLTLHHWWDKAAGLREALRVGSGKLVLLSWVGYINRFWLFDYFPEIETIDEEIFPSLEWMAEVTGARVNAEVVPIPADCSDGFMCAYWRRPEAYLDEGVRGAISTFARLQEVEERLRALRRDLESGAWRERYGELLQREFMDYGYRVLVLHK
jgi:SAM-dependent methyltransferase